MTTSGCREEFTKFITDPNSGLIYHTPIITTKGEIHEKDVFEEKGYHDTYYIIVAFKSLITAFIEKYPEYKKKQYAPNNIFKMTHSANRTKINSAINDGFFLELKKYNNYILSLIGENEMSLLLSNAPIDVIFHVIDNCNDINKEILGRSWTILNWACYRCSAKRHDVIKYIINKGGNMGHVCTNDGWYPLHQVIRFSTDDTFRKYFIEKHIAAGLDMFAMNQEEDSVLSYIMIYATSVELIEYTLGLQDMFSERFIEHLNRLLDRLEMNRYIPAEGKEKIISVLLSIIQ